MKPNNHKWIAYVLTFAVTLVLATLYWQSYRADLRSHRHVRTLHKLHEISLLDARLEHTVHRFRVERFHNFDVLHRLMREIDRGLEVLKSAELGLYANEIAGYDFAVDRYARAQMFRHELIEHFMRDVAILKNSLAFVSNSSSLAGGTHYIDRALDTVNAGLAHSLHRLQREVLVAANSQAPDSTGQVHSLIETIRSQIQDLSPEQGLLVDRLLQHSGIAFEYTDIVDSVSKQIGALRHDKLLRAIETSFLDHHAERLQNNRILSWFLYPLAGLAILYLVMALMRVSRLEESVLQRLNVADQTLGSMDDAIIVVDRDSRISFINPCAGEITACQVEEAPGQMFSELVPISSQITLLPLQQSVEDCMGREITIRLSQRLRLQNALGETHWIKFSASPLFDVGRECRGAVIVLRRTRKPSELASGHRVEGGDVTTERAVFESRLAGVLRRASGGRLVGALCYVGVPVTEQGPLDADASGLQKTAAKAREYLLACLSRNDEVFAEVGRLEYALLLTGTDNGVLMERGLEIREGLNAMQIESGGLVRNLEANVALMLIYQTDRAPEHLLDEARQAYRTAVRNGEGLHLAEAAA